MDYSIFDVSLDSVIVVDENRNILYCNEVAAALCNSSVQRMTREKPLYNFITFSDPEIFVMPEGTKGFDEPFPLEEVGYNVPHSDMKGKVQLALQPFEVDGQRQCAIYIRDVTIEEVLHAKYKVQLEQLEDYSKNLEKKVENRTAELNKANTMLNAIMNSLGQGFLVFDKKGQCLDIFTKACESVLEKNPAGMNIQDVLNLPASEREQFSMWMQAVFSNSLPFDSLKELGPQIYRHARGSHITLDYFPISDGKNGTADVVLVATEKTAEYEANIALEKEKQYAKMIVKLVTTRKQFSGFLKTSVSNLQKLKSEVDKPSPDVDYLFRILHTLEGEAGAFSVLEVRDVAKACQELISPYREDKNLRISDVSADLFRSIAEIEIAFEEFKNSNKELLTLLELQKNDVVEIEVEKVKEFSEALKKYNVEQSLVNTFLETFAKVPVRDLVYHYGNTVSQVADKQGKKTNPVEFIGMDVRVDGDRVKGLFTSLVHVFRNIVDHGLEMPDERIEQGKSEFGSIKVEIAKFSKEGADYLNIDILDDGRGINAEAIRQKLNSKGIDGADLSDHEVIQHVFDAGLSSRDEAGEFSGRGVGMDAIKSEVLALGGHVEIFSEAGQGTHLEISVPLNSTDLEIKKGA